MTGRLVAAAYVATVAALAGAGFAHESTAAILLAAALAFPSGVAGLVSFYLAYGLLALVPGANPSTSSGTASCTADGVCISSSVGDAATWFVVTTDVLGVAALVAAAAANVLLVRLVLRRPRRVGPS
jgi:hypothetical protein